MTAPKKTAPKKEPAAKAKTEAKTEAALVIRNTGSRNINLYIENKSVRIPSFGVSDTTFTNEDKESLSVSITRFPELSIESQESE